MTNGTDKEKRRTVDLKADKGAGGVRFLYCTALGKLLLKAASSRRIADAYGAYLNSKLSRRNIGRFIKRNKLDMSEYKAVKFGSFNEFFRREIRPECRTIEREPSALICPCDGNLTAFTVDKDSVFRVKGFDYSLAALLKDDGLAAEFAGGVCLIFRLTVRNYHRYCYLDGGTAEESVFIKGRLHTVQPKALEKRRVFCENCREYTLLHTDNFGDVLQTEVGAMFVGRIVNNGKRAFKRGEEKGWFEFGGSTIIVLLKKGAAEIDGEILENTANDLETIVKMGEKIGFGKSQEN